MLVGEQPGDREDREGRPFVGPAGRLLDEALEEAGIDRDGAYVTNVVKHFKCEPRGKRRIHQKPSRSEVARAARGSTRSSPSCGPRALVCLGATAAQALLGRQFRVTRERGRPLESELAPLALATMHPSSILRALDEEARRRELELFVADLRVVAEALQARAGRRRRASRPSRSRATSSRGRCPRTSPLDGAGGSSDDSSPGQAQRDESIATAGAPSIVSSSRACSSVLKSGWLSKGSSAA